ncbi:MAG: hypothetical protein LUH36_07620 [Oscillospiraceae bacterium]|nr:hypothetical protein [Oscillospiraceae bacterium]
MIRQKHAASGFSRPSDSEIHAKLQAAEREAAETRERFSSEDVLNAMREAAEG